MRGALLRALADSEECFVDIGNRNAGSLSQRRASVLFTDEVGHLNTKATCGLLRLVGFGTSVPVAKSPSGTDCGQDRADEMEVSLR